MKDNGIMYWSVLNYVPSVPGVPYVPGVPLSWRAFLLACQGVRRATLLVCQCVKSVADTKETI